jgi:hypothetical protein
MLSSTILFALFASLASTVHGHGTITVVTGANGITAAGMGIDPSTPRDGSRARPFQVSISHPILVLKSNRSLTISKILV